MNITRLHFTLARLRSRLPSTALLSISYLLEGKPRPRSLSNNTGFKTTKGLYHYQLTNKPTTKPTKHAIPLPTSLSPRPPRRTPPNHPPTRPSPQLPHRNPPSTKVHLPSHQYHYQKNSPSNNLSIVLCTHGLVTPANQLSNPLRSPPALFRTLQFSLL